MEIKTFLVEGMMCNNCKLHVENGIKTVPGVENVIVDISNGQVRVSANSIDINQVRGAIEQSGYVFKGEISITSLNSDHWLS
jgi:copper chaperone CopZ